MGQTVVLDDRLYELVDPDFVPEKIAGDCVFTEGPMWSRAGGFLVFSDIQGDTIYRWSPQDGQTVFRRPSGQSNGNVFDRQGRLLTCEHAGRRVSRQLPDGTVEAFATHFEGKRLNSPNDIICAPNGDVYFTDPPYGLRQPDGTFAPQEVPCNGVYRVSGRDGTLELLISDFERPNGLLMTDDGRRLLVDDTQEHHIRQFDVAEDGTLSNDRIFADVTHGDVVGRPDGMKFDSRGNLYTAASDDGIWVFDPSGQLLGFLGVPERAANLAWGGDDGSTLFITASTSVYRLPMRVSGQVV